MDRQADRAVVGGERRPVSRPGVGAMHNEGRRLFRKETFGGNGRTCETCHSRSTGTLSPEDVQERLKLDPNDPLFLHDGLDDGFSGTSRITEHATIRIERPLPPNIRIAEDPSATSVVLLRGIPGTLNTPALDPALMYDLRARTLEDQALDAIRDHAQNTVEPTAGRAAADCRIPTHRQPLLLVRRTGRLCARRPAARATAGERRASEQRGRLMFVETEFTPGSTKGICALCHTGPMLNQTSPFNHTGAPRCAHREHRRQRAEPPEPARIHIPDRRWLRRRASRHGCRILVSP